MKGAVSRKLTPTLSEQPLRAAVVLDEGRLAEARALAEQAIAALMGGSDAAAAHELDLTTLLRSLRAPEHGRILARSLWIASCVDEAEGRFERARARCCRAIELYARLRFEIDQIDVRAARELGAASARLGATR